MLKPLRFLAAATAPATVVAAVLTVAASPAGAVSPATNRLFGPDRYATSAAVAEATFQPGVPVAYVASGLGFADALGGGPAAAHEGGPLLLVSPTSVPASTAAALNRLHPARLVILGGATSVSTGVEETLRADLAADGATGGVTRVAGVDRYATAAAAVGVFAAGTSVFLVSGASFADALSASAAAVAAHAAVLLTDPASLSPATVGALEQLKPPSITIVGGPASVSATVQTQAASYSPTVTRLAGGDRYATSAAVANADFPHAAGVYVASGAGFADGLAAGPAAGLAGEPLILSARACLPPAAAGVVHSGATATVTLVGGVASLGPGVANLAACPTPSAPCDAQGTGTAYHHVVWIWMENKTYSSVVGSSSAPQLNAIAAKCGIATDYSGVAHPSLPNYIAATGGSTFGIADDADPSAHPINAGSLFSQLDAAGLSWRSYEESMPSNCDLAPASPYAVKHNPAAYYTGLRAACAAFDVPLNGHLDTDLANGTLPSFAFVTPNLCNDMHDCSVSTGDNWIGGWLPKILNSPNYTASDTLVVITWDEGTTADNRVPTIVIAPSVRPSTIVTTPLNHYALLRTTEDIFGLSQLGAAATSPSFATAFGL